jgi:hypothetical protein
MDGILAKGLAARSSTAHSFLGQSFATTDALFGWWGAMLERMDQRRLATVTTFVIVLLLAQR